jgi:hypothetical protein
MSGRSRCLVAHPIDPPYLVPAVEIVPAPWTDTGAIERARALMAAIGQAPMVMRREAESFIMNRLQAALVGLEDSSWIGPGRLTESNAAHIRQVRPILDGLGPEIATAAAAREILALEGGDQAAF